MSADRRQAAIVGDWTGEVASRQETEALAYRELRAATVRAFRYALDQRTLWANSDADGAVARAVAYQSMAGQIQRAIEAGDRIVAPVEKGCRA